MASGDATSTKERTASHAVLLQCFNGVLRARRVETAGGRQQWSEKQLVGAHEGDGDVSHTTSVENRIDATAARALRRRHATDRRRDRRPSVVPRSQDRQVCLTGAHGVLRARAGVVSTDSAPPHCVGGEAPPPLHAGVPEGKHSPEPRVRSFGEASPLSGCAQGLLAA